MPKQQERPTTVDTATAHEPEPLFVRAEQAARMLSVSEAWLNRRLADGTIPSTRIAGVRLVRVEDLRRLSA